MIPAALVENGTITPLLYAQGFTVNGIQYPANVLSLWTDADLAAIGVYPLVHAPVVLPYHIAGTPSYALVGAEVIESRTDTEMPLADVKLQKQAEIDMDFETSIQAVVSGYPQAERESWITQETEANGYPATTTPMLDGLALARGIPVSDIVARVKANAVTFKTVTATIIGAKQARSDALAASTTFAEAINV